MNSFEERNKHIMGFDKDPYFIGIVENRDDPLTLGRCQVRIIGVHPTDQTILPTTLLPWAIPMLPVNNSHAFGGMGISPTGPVVGTKVFGIFLDGMDRQQPMMMGTLAGGVGHFAAGVSQALEDAGKAIVGAIGSVVGGVGTFFSPNPLSSSVVGRGASFAAWLMKDLNSAGFAVKDFHAAAIMGNIAGESGIMAVAEGHPGRVAAPPPANNHKGGYGFAQWTGPRLTQYLNFCSQYSLNPQNDEANMRFLSYEMKTVYSKIPSSFAQGGSHTAAANPKGPHDVGTVEGATLFVLGQYERPSYSNSITSAPKRVAFAKQIWAGMTGAKQPVNGTGK